MTMQVQQVSETHVMLYLSDEIDLSLVSQLAVLRQQLLAQFSAAIVDAIPSYTSLLIEFNPLQTDAETISYWLTEHVSQLNQGDKQISNHIVLPVYYHPEVAPDLASLASHKKLTVEQVIDIHTNTRYTVCAIGFAPGFAFLASVPDAIAMPRHAEPRLKVPAGSVGIANEQTAVYPAESPGGWQIIGNCPIALFTPAADPMMPFNVGDTVSFESVDRKTFLESGGQICKDWK